MYLNPWSLVGADGEVLEPLAGRVLLKEVCPWEPVLGVCSLLTFPPPKPEGKVYPFFLKWLLVMVILSQQEKSDPVCIGCKQWVYYKL